MSTPNPDRTWKIADTTGRTGWRYKLYEMGKGGQLVLMHSNATPAERDSWMAEGTDQ